MRLLLCLCVLAIPACSIPEPEVVYALPDDLALVCHEGQYALISPSLRRGRILPLTCI